MEVIPAIDLLDGKVVRLRQGRYDEVTVYSDDPAALARTWSEHVDRLHLVDLEGARDGHAVQRDLVQRVVGAFDGRVQIGGGIRSLEAAQSYLDLGVARVVLGTAALRDPDLVRAASGRWPERVIVAVDARGGMVATEGWLDVSTTPAVDVVKRYADVSLAGVLYTDIERDGTEVGPNVAATAKLARESGFGVIASGGVGTLDHLRELSAAGPGIVAAIVGRALHEGRFSLDEAVRATATPPD